MKRPIVEKITIMSRRCWICRKLWPAGTTYHGKLGKRDEQFSCNAVTGKGCSR